MHLQHKQRQTQSKSIPRLQQAALRGTAHLCSSFRDVYWLYSVAALRSTPLEGEMLAFCSSPALLSARCSTDLF